ncbi:RHS repeat-associated core domain-containing protein [Nocardia stercoris]|uniref:RHS repeat-associated core domain-containing protein n=1 Tax=Nocardia stercoris TaxID=2483361 RepID=UPI001319BA79|nr:RHS repeat-associated core domain-containing protein [Nocardia stercoris]
MTDGAGTSGTTVATSNLQGQVSNYQDANGIKTANTFDTSGRLIRAATTNSSGLSSEVEYTFDNASRLKTVALDYSTAATVTYDAAGQANGITYSNGTSATAPQRNNTGALTSLEWKGPAFDYLSKATRSQNNRITDEGIYTGGTTQTQLASDSYTYDAGGRLVAATVPHHQLTYGFAPTGGCGQNTAAGADTNRTSFSDSQDGAAATTTTYCYDNTDRLVSSSSGGTPTYDAYGDTTKIGGDTLAYDAASRHLSTTTASGTTITYTRDAGGRILQRTLTGSTTGTTRYGYTDGGGSPSLVLVPNGLSDNVQRVLPLPGGVVLSKSYAVGQVRNWSYPDIRGNVLFTTDNSGGTVSPIHVYDPYGQDINPTTGVIGDIAMPQTEQGGMDLGWQGGNGLPIEHSGGQQYIEMGARTYLPSLGRFLQADPVAGGSANGYQYTYGDPINANDPTGRDTDWLGIISFACGIGALVATLAGQPAIAAGFEIIGGAAAFFHGLLALPKANSPLEVLGDIVEMAMGALSVYSGVAALAQMASAAAAAASAGALPGDAADVAMAEPSYGGGLYGLAHNTLDEAVSNGIPVYDAFLPGDGPLWTRYLMTFTDEKNILNQLTWLKIVVGMGRILGMNLPLVGYEIITE